MQVESSPSCNPTPAVDAHPRDKFLFGLVLAYLVIDYARIQDHLPIKSLRPGLVITGLILFSIVTRIKPAVMRVSQIRYIGLFCLLLAFYIPFAVNNYYAYLTTRTIFIYLVFILAVLVTVKRKNRLLTLLDFNVAILIYISLYSISNVGLGSGNYFKDENDLAMYVNCMAPIPFCLGIVEKKKFKKLFYLLAVFLSVGASLISFSRGGFLGLIAITVFISFLSRKILLPVFMGILGLIVVTVYFGDTYWNEMETISDVDTGTANARILYWKDASKMFLDNPLGVGGGNFPVRFPEYQSSVYQRGMWGRVSHSIWFTLLPETGIPGVVIFFLLIKRNVRDALCLRRPPPLLEKPDPFFHALGTAFLCSFIGFFVSGSFLSVLYYPHYWYLTGFLAVSCEVAANGSTV